MSLRCSHDCLRGVDYLLYLFGRAFIALTPASAAFSSFSITPLSPLPPLALFRSTAKARIYAGHTNGQEVR